MASILNSAYIKHNFNTTVISGINYYPYKIPFKEYMDRVTVFVSHVLPAAMIMGMPMFLINIVSEKEKRLIENMKINGMNMSYYWVATYAWFYMYYTLVQLTFFFVGKYVFTITFMKYTSPAILLTVLNGWTMAQISYAFFLSVFIQK